MLPMHTNKTDTFSLFSVILADSHASNDGHIGFYPKATISGDRIGVKSMHRGLEISDGS